MAYLHTSERYRRQISLKEFGPEGQRKLADAKVLVIGAGGLGCPVLHYLAGAGTGVLGIVDHDIVTLSNLHRQLLYSTADIGRSKATRAAEILRDLNPDISVEAYDLFLESSNILDIMVKYNLVVDCTDNFPTRYMINDACVLTGKGFVYGAISGFEGQVAVFNFPVSGPAQYSSNYRDLFPEPPGEGEVQNCEEAGVLGVLPGMIGIMMANEVIKCITGLGEALVNKLFTFDALSNQSYLMEIIPDRPATGHVLSRQEFEAADYKLACSVNQPVEEIEPEIFLSLIGRADTRILDVREKGEIPQADFEHDQLPLSEIRMKMPVVSETRIVLFCQSGKRSMTAGKILKEYFGDAKRILSLKGGILNLKDQKIS